MYGADAGATYHIAALGGGAPSLGMGTAVDATMTPGTTTAAATPVQTFNILPASIGGAGLLGNTVAWWFALIVLIVAAKWAAEHNGEAGEFATIRVGLLNVFIITVCSIIGRTALKMLLSKYRFAGLTDLVLGS
jgi:hypothetical protein